MFGVVPAYDNYPMDAIAMKKKWIGSGVEAGSWFTFYHDPFLFACKFGDRDTVIQDGGMRPRGELEAFWT